MPANPVETISQWRDEFVALRRDIHAYPELAFEEQRTGDLVAQYLERWGIEVHRGIGRTGLVGVVKGQGAGVGSVGLRADMDCLPMTEHNTFPHASRSPGRMHACGHDGHTTMLLAAGRYLAQTRRFDGTAYLIFQPAEEGGGGGEAMVRDGLFARFPADRIFALHNWPELPPGTVAVRPGPMMAATDTLEIVITGRSGHAAMPHLTNDPTVVAAQLILGLQGIVSRNVHPLDAAVISVSSLHSDTVGSSNVIPDEVRMLGTVRTFLPAVRERVHARIREISAGLGAAYGAQIACVIEDGYPATVNSPAEAAFAAQVAAELFLPERVHRDFHPTMGAEDFSYMLQERPGAYIWFGQGGGPLGCGLHNAHYDFNDDILPMGAGYLAALVERALPVS